MDKALAIKCVTENPAKAMKLKGKGKVEEGYDGDVVIRDGEKLRYVISKGQILLDEGCAKRSMFDDI